MPSRPRGDDDRLQQVRVGRAIGQAQFEPARPGTRTMWVRLLPVHVTVLGAHVAPDSVRGALMRL
jgi:hypothetical protein